MARVLPCHVQFRHPCRPLPQGNIKLLQETFTAPWLKNQVPPHGQISTDGRFSHHSTPTFASKEEPNVRAFEKLSSTYGLCPWMALQFLQVQAHIRSVAAGWSGCLAPFSPSRRSSMNSIASCQSLGCNTCTLKTARTLGSSLQDLCAGGLRFLRLMICFRPASLNWPT